MAKFSLLMTFGMMLLGFRCGTGIAQETRSAKNRNGSSALPDLALRPPQVITNVGPDHAKNSRGAQGVPAIERTPKGRLWAAWYAGKSQRGRAVTDTVRLRVVVTQLRETNKTSREGQP